MKADKNKILFILHLPPPVHGASVMGKYICESKIINKEFDCKYINLSASETVDEVGVFSFNKLLFLTKNTLEVIITIIKFRPKLCYITPTSDGMGFYRDFLLVAIQKFFRVRVLLHFHNKANKVWIEKKHNRILLKVFFKNVKIILLDKVLYQEKSEFIDFENVFICPNGIEKENNFLIEKDLNKKVIDFLFLSNMMVAKGVFILLEACSRLKQMGYNFRCDFIGNWKDIEPAQFHSKVVELDLNDHVSAHGAKYGVEKHTYLSNADVLIFPTYYHGETFGLVLLEAMDYALPCIAADNGAIKSVIDNGITGIIVEQKNVDELVKQMVWMIENPTARIEMGLLGKKRFDENFTSVHFEKKMFNILNECIK